MRPAMAKKERILVDGLGGWVLEGEMVVEWL